MNRYSIQNMVLISLIITKLLL